ncbi:MAG: hypothetical protein IJJ94_02545 [Bacteroidaceae bacterium]|nr:hypothetical protein [Bacteroidaceae bacterium]
MRPSLYDEYLADEAYTGSSWQRTNNISKGAFEDDESFAAFGAHAAATFDDLNQVRSVDRWFDHHTNVKDLTALGYTAVNALRAADMQKLTKLEKIALPYTLQDIQDGSFAKSPELRYVDMLMCNNPTIVDDIKSRGLTPLGIDSLQTLVYLPRNYGEAHGVNIIVNNGANLEAETFRLVDGKDYCVPYAFDAKHIDNTRKLENSSVTYTICLPYNMSVPAGAKAYKLTGRKENTLVYTQVTGQLEAFQPYLLTIGSKPVTLATDMAQTIPSSLISEGDQVDGDGVVMRGTLASISNAEASSLGALVLQSDNIWHPVKSGNKDDSIPAFRAYLVSRGSSGNFGIDLQDDTVDIRQIDDDADDDAWYDLGGRRLEGMPSRGIYIHNGRKVVVQ